jgi:hypothetical protein
MPIGGAIMPESQQNSGEKTFAIPAQYVPDFSRGPHISSVAWTAADEHKDTRSMELPRGRFRGVRRNIRLAFLLRDLSDDRFTGYCRITHAEGQMVIVLKRGMIILAENQGIYGDDALEAVLVSQRLVVDAELNELNASQLKLALEFNPESRVSEGRLIDPVSQSRTIIPVDKSREPDSSGGQSSTPRPLTHFIDTSLSRRTKDKVETVPEPVKTVAFEPLVGNSVLFEAKKNGNKGLLKDVPVHSERWRFMGAASRENFSV